MHEYSIVEALIDRAEAEARARQAVAVAGLAVRIGTLSGVDPRLVSSAYEVCRPGTLCAHAPLQIVSVDARWECPSCALAVTSDDALTCPVCGAPARLVAGDEILLESVEIEVPDV